MGFGMLFLVLAHLLQERQSLILQSRKLKKQSGIEHYVGILLIRENPFFFSRSHTGPTAYGFLRRVSAIFVVPYNAAQKAADKAFSTDDLPHLLMGIAGISSPLYDARRDLLNPTFNDSRKRILKRSVDYDSLMTVDRKLRKTWRK